MFAAMKAVVLAVVLIVFCAPAWAGPDLQEGLWEITTTTEMSGMPMQMPPQKHTQCLKKDDYVPHNPHGQEGCTVTQQSVAGNTVNWTMECSADGMKTVAAGSIIYSGDSFTGRMEVTIEGMDIQLVNTMIGRRLGPCQ